MITRSPLDSDSAAFVARSCNSVQRKPSWIWSHSSVAFTLDRYGHLYEDAEDEIPERLDALYNAYNARQRAPRRCSRWGVFGEMSADLRFYEWTRGDLNP
jgi:hypothetical protein